MFSSNEKRRQLRHSALCRDVEVSKQQESYHKGFNQIQKNSQINLAKRQHSTHCKNLNQEINRQDEEAKEKARQKQLEEEHAQELAMQLHEANRRRINEERLRQQLRESNQELRELESKLRAAYVAKGIAAQKAEQEVRRMEEKMAAQKEQEELEQLRLKNLDYIRQCQEDELKEKQNLRDVLHIQMQDIHRQKQVLYEEFIMEKMYLDEVCKKIQEEQFAEIQRKLELQERTRKEMEYFNEAKIIWQERQKLAMAEENDRIKQYLEAREAEQAEQNRRKIEITQSRERLNEKMVIELQSQIDEARNREELFQDLYSAELNERQENRLQRDLEHQLRKRIEARLGLERQLSEIECRRQREAEEERQFKEDQLKLWAERDRIDQMTDEKRRLKLMEHRRAIQQLMEDRKRQRAAEVKELIDQQNTFEQEEKRRQKIIEEERIKLLKEHAAALLGFLPPGVLRESDREHIPLPKPRTVKK